MSVFPSTSNWVTLACLSVFCGQSGALIYVTQDRFHAFAVHDSTSLCILSHQSPSAALFPPPVLRAVCPYLLPCSLLLSRKNETNVSPHSVTVQILAKPFHAVTWKQLASVCNQQTERGGVPTQRWDAGNTEKLVLIRTRVEDDGRMRGFIRSVYQIKELLIFR